MQDSEDNINLNPSILVSRNRPIAFIVGVAGFLGSHLAEELLENKLQVIGVDDFSTGRKENLEKVIRDKNFHLINQSISGAFFSSEKDKLNLLLPRLDYAFFIAESEDPEQLFTRGVVNFLNFVKTTKEEFEEEEVSSKKEKVLARQQPTKPTNKPRIVLVSSVELYNNKLERKQSLLKEAEIAFAKHIKYYKLNGRVIRLAAIFGPRMHFREDDPTTRLIQASLLDKLNEEQTSLEFSSRSLFVDDAISLLIKSVFSGSTAQKIYDGVSFPPIKVAEIKQILLDPLWHEQKQFKPTELPPWPTPNLEKTIKELAWKPRTDIIEALRQTLKYFKDHQITVPDLDKGDFKSLGKRWSFKSYQPDDEQSSKTEKSKEDPKQDQGKGFFSSLKKDKHKLIGIISLIVIFYVLFLPFFSLGVGAFSIREHLKSSSQALEQGDFTKAQNEIKQAQVTLTDSRQILDLAAFFKRIGIFPGEIDKMDQLLFVVEEGIDGANHATAGTQALFQATKIISGESRDEPKPIYEKAQSELTTASQKIGKVKARLADKAFLDQYHPLIKEKAQSLAVKLNVYADLVEKVRDASFLMPQITAVDGKKSYLVLLQNNLELRPGGGFIGSYAKLTFEGGRLINIKVDDIYNLDGNLADVIEPSAELKTDLGQNRLFLRDSNTEPDFPVSARTAQFFYKKEAGETVNGVFALDLSASAKLVAAVGGLDLPEYAEKVTEDNLFEKAIAHAEVNFFPGSQAKKNYLTSLQTQLLNKIFYLSKQNWPAIIQAVSKSLEQKHLMIYLADPQLFSYLVSENWAGVMPRGVENQTGVTNDFLATIESNMGANKANFYLERKYNLDTSIGKEGEVLHKLTIKYKNNSPSDVFPAGSYKNRLKLYLPLGSKLTRVLFADQDILNQTSSFVDYGRTGYSMFIIIKPKEEKSLTLEYTLAKGLQFKDNIALYRLDVFKQAGTMADEFDWKLTYPINLSIASVPKEGLTSAQELILQTNLLQDRAFTVTFKKP